MAKICFIREGLTGRADPVAEKASRFVYLGLSNEGLVGDLETQFTIDKWLELSPHSRLRWVVIQLDETEASSVWKPGYYFSPIMKVDQVKKLIA